MLRGVKALRQLRLCQTGSKDDCQVMLRVYPDALKAAD